MKFIKIQNFVGFLGFAVFLVCVLCLVVVVLCLVMQAGGHLVGGDITPSALIQPPTVIGGVFTAKFLATDESVVALHEIEA